MQANALRSGMCVLHNNEVCSIRSVTHRTPGNLRAFVQVRMRNLKNGNSSEHRFASTESVERAIRECLDARKDPNLGEIPALKNAIKAGQWQGDMKRDIALYLRDMMQTAKKWKESTQAKKPEKDGDYQDTLLVQSWIAGK